MRLRPLSFIAAVLAASALMPAAASAAAKVGVSDQNAATFTSPFFAPLKMTVARYIAPYDATSDLVQSTRLADWIKAARAAHQRILVSFEHSRTAGRQQQAPTIAQYTKAMKAFHKEYPDVKDISPWNEVNRCQSGGRTEGQPKAICRLTTGPKLTAQYYSAARKVFRGASFVALDVLDQNDPGNAVSYIKKFRHYAKPTPTIWGFHNYSDTNRFSTKRTKKMMAATKSGQIWLTETGGIVKLGSSFPYDESRAAKALGCMFSIAKTYSSRIKRLYIYQYTGASPEASFDAGLINEAGTATRPGYDVVKSRKARTCKK